jgi:hypothetical protein
MNGIKVYSNERAGPLQRGDNHKSSKIGTYFLFMNHSTIKSQIYILLPDIV